MSEKVKPQHRARKAMLYVRQSSPAQVTQNQESQRLQYAMRDRLRDLGWSEIEVVDEDLGRSAAGTTTRSGFQRLVAEVCLGQVGAVAAREVSRFARNSREWQHLIEVCRMVDTVLIDQETVYDPRLSNDRLLLGLKGTLNEYELDLLRQRALEARNAKARRGEYLGSLPVGYLKTLDGRQEMDPDQRVQGAIRLVFEKCLELGSCRRVLLWLLEHKLDLPTRRYSAGSWEVVWQRPRYKMVHQILRNPTYAGAYAYGRTVTRTGHENGVLVKRRQCRQPREEWLAFMPGHHDGYIAWEQFERIQEMLQSNGQKFQEAKPGAAKRGMGLLVGLMRCRRCARKMMVAYSGTHGCRVVRYNCRRGCLDGGPACIGFGGLLVDAAVGRELLRVVQPAALEASRCAEAEQSRAQEDVLAALTRELQAARYTAERAGKQYDATDPANRLVADELERRWNVALERVQEVEQRIAEVQRRAAVCRSRSPLELRDLASDLEAVWNHPQTDARLKKRLLRTLIHEVIADIDEEHGEVVLVVHWQGGVHTELRVPRRQRGHRGRVTALAVVDAVRSLARICRDRKIATILNWNGLRTGPGNGWTQERVTSMRIYHEIPHYSAERAEAEGWMTLKAAASFLGITPRTLRLGIERGDIQAERPLSIGPWVVSRAALQTKEARRLVDRVRRTRARGAIPAPGQQTLDFSAT